MAEQKSDIIPFNSDFLPVSSLHSIYYEQSGNPQGIPLLRIHGGPGSSSKPKHRTYFDNQKFRIILYDQRGCGQSTPFGEVQENTTQELVADIERLRQQLHIEKWIIVGASWGSTLALLYAEQYPQHIIHLIVQGVFTGRQSEIDWLFGNELQTLFPDQFQKLIHQTNLNPNQRLTPQIYQQLTSSDQKIKMTTAQAVSEWEYSLSSLEMPLIDPTREFTHQDFQSTFLEHHYMFNNCFLSDNQILDNAHTLKNTPLTIVQGRYDMICPFITAGELYQHCPHATFIPVIAGHHETGQDNSLAAALRSTLMLL